LSGDREALDGAMGAFLAAGFHGAKIEDIEQATGLRWSEICARFGDKEGLFFAATEQRLDALTAGPTRDATEIEAIRDLVRRVSAAGATVMLRAQHRQALQRLSQLAEAAAEQ
jgi:AcrR family transcriptional regulator